MKDRFEDILKNKFENFNVDVNPKLWDGIAEKVQSTNTIGTQSTQTGVFKSMSIISKLLISGVISSCVILGGYFILKPKKEKVVDVIVADVQVLEEKTTSVIIQEKENTDKEEENNAFVKTELINVENPSEKSRDELKGNFDASTFFTDLEKEVEQSIEVTSSVPEKENPYKVDFKSSSVSNNTVWKVKETNQTYVGNSPQIEFLEEGKYTIEVSTENKEGEKVIVEEKYEVKNEEAIASAIIIPNVFTPNGDGNNDEFYISNTDNIKELLLKVYDQNTGNLIYQNTALDARWDGMTIEGNEAQEAKYIAILAIIGKDGSKTTKRTVVLLKR